MLTGYIGICTPLKQDVNIRQQPSISSKIVGVLRYRDTLPVAVVGSEWVRVEYAGEERFIARHILFVDMD